jgi:hypothetical protein
MYDAKAYSVASATSPFAATPIKRRDPTAHDVQIEILFCGVCHSDLHAVRSEWSGMPTIYPCVPGHEIVGRVTRVGSAVTRLRPGDLAGVGCLVDSDGTCPECRANLEQFCPDGTSISQGRPLCAGITTWSPLRRQGVTQGKKVGGRSRRARPHGREVRPRARRPRGRLHHVRQQEGGCAPPRRPRDRRLTHLRPGWFTRDEEIDYRITHKGEPFVGHDVSLNSVSDLIVKLALSPTMEVRRSLGVSRT